MRKFSTLFCVAALAVFATAAFADDDDPTLNQIGNAGCGATDPPSLYWCTNSVTGIDPTTGDSTLELVLRAGSSSMPGIAPLTSSQLGWVEFANMSSSPTTIYDYLDFVALTSGPYSGQDAIFLYCVNLYCGSNDAGAPSTLPASPVIVATSAPTSGGVSAEYSPSSTQPGGGLTYPPPGGTATGYTVLYGGSTSGVSMTDVAVPEASSGMLLGSMLFGLAAFCASRVIRRRQLNLARS